MEMAWMLIFASPSASQTRARVPGRFARNTASCLVICIRCILSALKIFCTLNLANASIKRLKGLTEGASTVKVFVNLRARMAGPHQTP
jgi:hypothetical protein